MKIKEMINILSKFENQDAELILAFEDGVDVTNYEFAGDDTSSNGYVDLLVNGYFEEYIEEETAESLLNKNLKIRWLIADILPFLNEKDRKKYQNFFKYSEKIFHFEIERK